MATFVIKVEAGGDDTGDFNKDIAGALAYASAAARRGDFATYGLGVTKTLINQPGKLDVKVQRKG